LIFQADKNPALEWVKLRSFPVRPLALAKSRSVPRKPVIAPVLIVFPSFSAPLGVGASPDESAISRPCWDSCPRICETATAHRNWYAQTATSGNH